MRCVPSLRTLRLAFLVLPVVAIIAVTFAAEESKKPTLKLQRRAAVIRLSGTPAATEVPAVSPASQGTHTQVAVIKPIDADSKQQLTCFCLTKEGQIVAVINLHGGADAHQNLLPATDEKHEGPPCEVRMLDADGKLLTKWPVDFRIQAVNVGVDGNIVLGGDGTVARYAQDGKQLGRAEAPHLVASRNDPDALERRAREAVDEQATTLVEGLKQFEAQQKELDAKKESELTPDELELKQELPANIQAYKNAIATLGDEQREQRIQQMKQMLLGMQRKISAIAAGEKHVFITCTASKGFGYGVWRADLDFGHPEQIVDGLSGCCGQMDVQCCGPELVVAENSRHRVVRYDAEGKEVNHWGKRSRDGEGENFGGCCNPMNTRLAADKLYVAESDGSVKLFSLDGKYLGYVGKAEVQPGCKSSIVDVSPDEERVYCFNVHASSICVLKRRPSTEDQAAN